MRHEGLSSAEHEELVRLAAQLHQIQESARGAAARLRPAREDSPRAEARSRLECVIHDYLVPAARDTESIVQSAARALEDAESD
jgi:hypothetical protein